MLVGKTIVITGASGLLGRALMTNFRDLSKENKVIGTSFSRTKGDLYKLDLTDPEKIQSFISETRPDFVIHSAAQRFPNKVDGDLEASRKLNVEGTKALAESVHKIGGRMLYVSTDYVFDGKNPPFLVTDPTNPLQNYGKQKLEGERETMKVDKNNLVLRIPVLYGPVEYLGESAVTSLFADLLKKEDSVSVSNYEKRRPSHVNDIANIIRSLLEEKDEARGGIYQWCGHESLTKFEMIKIMASVFGLDYSHITPTVSISGRGGAPRPYDTTMDTSKLTNLGISFHTPFKDGIKSAALDKWNQ